jgi:DNA-binding NarL/FixJ family response regulator
MSIRVLLVDDHIVLLEGMSRIIEMEKDMQVVGQATNGSEAIAMVKKSNPDVVLMDINMPEMDGLRATQIIKENSPHIEVLILTMFDKAEYLFWVTRAGASGYLLKDSPSHEVIHAIRVVSKGESILHPSMAKKLMNQYSNQTLSPIQLESHASIQEIRETQEPWDNKELCTDSLSPRELEVIQLLVDGNTNKEIAGQLYISDKTVKIHVNKIYKKFKVKSRSQAIIYAIQNQVIKDIYL